MVSISRILCPIDFSDFSLDALRHGLALAQWYSAHLTLLHVLKVVADDGVDLVVMGVQGKGVVNRLVFGSTTHRVIREAGCPVLTLHSGSVGVP